MAVSPAKEKANAANSKKQKDIKSLNGRQKAAIFLVAVGEEISAKIMEQMREDEIEKLVFEIARTETVESELKEAVLQEFQDLMAAQNFITTGGIDYARGLLEKSLGSQKAIEVINRLTSSLQVRPFDFIRRTDPAHLLNFIQQEHPQTIALILAYLEPQKASVILQNLPDEIQSDVARRIATMDRTSPDVLREVERVLEKKLSTLSSEDYTAAGGVESIVEILNLVDRSSEKSIIESLEEDDPDLAEEIKGLQERNAMVIEKKDGTVAKDDIVTINYKELDDEGKTIAGTEREDFVFTVGTGENIYKIDDEIIGMKKDETKEITKKYKKDSNKKRAPGIERFRAFFCPKIC